jgi:hypothetical protein
LVEGMVAPKGVDSQLSTQAGGAGRTLQRFDVWNQLDQIARNKTGAEAEIAENLYQQPGGVAA